MVVNIPFRYRSMGGPRIMERTHGALWGFFFSIGFGQSFAFKKHTDVPAKEGHDNLNLPVHCN